MDFKLPYNRESFLNFLQNSLLPDDFETKQEKIDIDFKTKFINKVTFLGESTSLDLKVYEAVHPSENDPRVGLSSEIFRLLANFGVKRALVIFVSSKSLNYRFSLVTINLVWEHGRRVQREYSNPRRYSFYLGPDAKVHTPYQFLVQKGHVTDFEDLLSRFNVEIVTKVFFKEYRELFEKLTKYLNKDNAFKIFASRNNISIENFAKKLLGQIVFIYFLQRKGWLGAKRENRINEGDKDFLRNLFNKSKQEGKNFFNEYLEPLFYNALNSKSKYAANFYRDYFDCQIPFLNGGLFEPLNNYDWENEFIHLPDELFSNNPDNPEKDGGILDIFDLYNFTVAEDDPVDKEVSIDPEMLGKVFENLLEENLRKGKGTYYTPREIVYYMCKESLVNYLTTVVDLTSNDVRNKYFPPYNLLGDKKFEARDVGVSEKIIESLENIKVVDPACGSGAFLVGMLQQITRLRYELETRSKLLGRRKTASTEYEIKKQTIQNCIYGVDIDPGAVEIAKLRLWLSLVVDYELDQVEPLPNLDYKIMVGNSLIEKLDASLLYNSMDDKKNELIEKVKENKENYFNASDLKTKANLRFEINELVRMLINYENEKERNKIWSRILDRRNQIKMFDVGEDQKSFADVNTNLKKLETLEDIKETGHFEWHLNFNEVFENNKGFDIVIANPPYMKERDNKKNFEIVNNSELGKKYHQGKMDYWYYFLHKAIDLVRSDGSICYITSRYWINSYGAKKLIDRVKMELSFLNFVDIGKLKVFDNVAGQHMIALYTKNKKFDNFTYKKLENDLSDISINKNTDNLYIKILKNSKLYTSNYEIQLEDINENLDNIIKLGNISDISQGVVEAPDKISKKALEQNPDPDLFVGKGVFVLKQQELDHLKLNNTELDVIKKYLDPSDIFKFGIKKNTRKFLIYSDKKVKEKISNNEEFIDVKKHLDRFKKFITSSNRPYGLHRPRDIKYFVSPKIIFKNMFVSNDFTYDNNEYFVGFSFSLIISKDRKFDLKYILSILNSRFALSWFYKNGKKRGAGVDIGVEKLRFFPIKNIPPQEQKLFINLVDKILAITDNEDYLENLEKQVKVKEYEKQIDQLVYKLYGLTPEEVEIVEGRNENH